VDSREILGEPEAYALSYFSLGTTKIKYRLTGIAIRLRIKTAAGSVNHPVSLETPTRIRPISPKVSKNLPTR
jgi:hypothetical protein